MAHHPGPPAVNGVVYNIRRRVGENGPDTLVGATGQKRFEDTTVPAGASMMTYTIQAQRGSLVASMMAAIQVRFGVGGPGFTTTTLQIPSTDIKMAA
ncbi:MAG: hypothetical protein AB7G11_06940 [Phycisphaerales bacterium]